MRPGDRKSLGIPDGGVGGHFSPALICDVNHTEQGDPQPQAGLNCAADTLVV